MKCPPGQHTYRPFPKSYTLFCTGCGDIADEAAPRHVNARPPAPPAETGRQTELPLDHTGDDPNADAARQIIADHRAKSADQRAREHFESEIRRIVGESDMDPEQAEEFVRDALDFGVALDLDKFQELVGAHQRARPAEDDAADRID